MKAVTICCCYHYSQESSLVALLYYIRYKHSLRFSQLHQGFGVNKPVNLLLAFI